MSGRTRPLPQVILIERKVLRQRRGMTRLTVVAFLEAVAKRLPVKFCPGYRAVPGMIKLPDILAKQGELITNFSS